MPASTTKTRSSHVTTGSLPVSPMSERQQMKLVRQLETGTSENGVKESKPHRPRSRSCNGRGETALHKAAIKGDHDLVRSLLLEGANPNVSDFAGWSPLHEACNHGWFEVACELVDAGADVNARGFDDDTPLHDAAINGHIKLIQFLVGHGADVYARNKSGKTPCDVAPPSLLPFLISTNDKSKPSKPKNTSSAQNDQTAICEMRRTPPHTKVEKSPRVTLRLQQIKSRDDKKSGRVTSDGYTSKIQFAINMEDKSSKEDVYEYKNSKESTPSPDTSDKASDDKQAHVETMETDSIATKRSATDAADNEDNNEEGKKKKRKDGELGNKSASGRVPGARSGSGVNPNAEKSKGNHSSNKTQNAASSKTLPGVSTQNTDRKSPSSPKGSASTSSNSSVGSNTAKTEGDVEEKGADGEKGPKVPPLKIVIPQQSGNEPETGNRSSAARHTALPYVVSSNSNDSEKDGPRSGSASPTDSDPAIGMLSAEDQKGSHQRVLRSTHRSGPEPGNGQTQKSATEVTSTSGGSTAPTNSASFTNCTATNTGKSQEDQQQVSSQHNSPSAPEVTAAAPTAGPVACDAVQPSSSGSSRPSSSAPSKPSTSSTATVEEKPQTPTPVDLHPRKRKLKHNKEVKETPPPQPPDTSENVSPPAQVHPHEQPVQNCYQLFLDIRKQIEKRRKSLFPVQPKPPQGYKDYLMNRCTYVLAGNAANRQIPSSPIPPNLHPALKDLFQLQEKERHRLRVQHVIEKEKLVLSVEQEILRVHGRAARALANQSLPFSVCTILKDEEVYNLITPEQEEKDKNARSRYNGRLFLSWLQDVDDKWDRIKEAMLRRHHKEAESLHAVQKMDWEWKMKELGICEFKTTPVILDSSVPMVHVSVDFDLLPA